MQGNPAGRLRGSRNKLTEAVICALLRFLQAWRKGHRGGAPDATCGLPQSAGATCSA